MKLELNTRLFPQYNPMVSLAEKREKEAEEAKKAEEEKKVQELYEALDNINSFALGTTPNFTIDLNRDLLKLEDIEQLIVTFGQFGQVVQREILYFSDNYDIDLDEVKIDSEGNYIPSSADIIIDEPHWKKPARRDPKDIFDDNIHLTPTGKYDSDGNEISVWKHYHQTIKNPKFSYNRIYNVLTLTLSQMDTLTHFKPTYWYYHKEDEDKPNMPYWKNNPSLVMIEVKIRVKNFREEHLMNEVIIRPQEYWAVADTIEHSLKKPIKRVNTYDPRFGADPIYVPHRFRYYYGDYSVQGRDLPDRVEALPHSGLIAPQILVRDGLKVRSYPQFIETSEVPSGKMEIARYFCVMIPLHIKVKVKTIKVLYGGSPGIMDHVDYDTTGLTWDSEDMIWRDDAGIPTQPRVIPSYLRYADHEFNNEGNSEYDGSIKFDEYGNPVYQLPWRNETVYFNSNYVIDPDGAFPENPMGEYICWYICTRETVTGTVSRYFGPTKYREDQRKEPYYEFLIQFEEVGKANY